MAGLFKQPKSPRVQPVEPTPTIDVQEVDIEERKKARRKSGRRKTILTGEDELQPTVGRKTILG